MIVAMAIVTTLAMPPSLRWALSRLPLHEEERVRLEREAFEAKGFVPNVERLLLAIDDSANGKLALRLAGSIAASRGITSTVLHFGSGNRTAAVRASLMAAQSAPEEHNEVTPTAHLTRHSGSLSPETALKKELQKGYDLLVLGIANTVAPQGGFHEEISRLASVHGGPLAIIAARGTHVAAPASGGLNILVPVRGNKVSRRAAEVALALAKATDSPLTALYVLSTVGLGAPRQRLRRPTRTRRYEESVLKDIVSVADRYEQSIRTALRLDVSPEDAILRQVRLGNYNLIVMGVGRPAGEALFFGKVATAVLDNSPSSIMFVSS